MCSRFTLISRPELIASHFGLQNVDPFPPRYNIAPDQPVAIIRNGYRHEREMALVRWGLIPDWVKDPGEFSQLINARAETLVQKPSFRNAYKYRRCLFPMDGFFEWSGPKGQRQPWYISARDKKPFGVAGLWENWMGVDGSEMESAVIVTMKASADIAPVHPRMPVVIAPDQYRRWLDCSDGLACDIAPLLVPDQTGFFKLHRVSEKVNNPGCDHEDVLEPIGQLDLL